MGGAPRPNRTNTKKIEAREKRMKIRQNGVRLCRANLVAMKENPQNRTARTRAMYGRTVLLGMADMGEV